MRGLPTLETAGWEYCKGQLYFRNCGLQTLIGAPPPADDEPARRINMLGIFQDSLPASGDGNRLVRVAAMLRTKVPKDLFWEGEAKSADIEDTISRTTRWSVKKAQGGKVLGQRKLTAA